MSGSWPISSPVESKLWVHFQEAVYKVGVARTPTLLPATSTLCVSHGMALISLEAIIC